MAEDELKRAAELSDPTISLDEFIFLVGDHRFDENYKIHEKQFPEPRDFINMIPRTAFIRKERAQNVTAFKTHAPPPPVAGIKGQILHNMRDLHAERQQARPAATPKKSNVIPIRPEAEPAGLADGVTITKQPASLQNQPRKPQKEKLTF